MINSFRILKREIFRSWWLPGLFAVLLGCSEKAAEPASFSEPAYSRQYRAGALTAIVSLSETNIPSSGKITALLEVHAPAGIDPVFPNLGNAIDPFAIADTYSEPAQALPNGKRLYRQVWMLVPGLPGRTEFQSLEIRAGDERLETEPVTVTVTSLLPPDTEKLALRDIAAPIEQLPEQQNKRRSLYTLIGTLLVLALIPFVIHLLRKPKTVIAALPHEDAFRALENLPEEPVARVHELNRIFRTYHEARFGFPMLGKTAVELSSVIEDTEIIRFLESCDAVRFSNKVPEGFAAEAEEFVRGYIAKTMEEPA